jgi:hypothetical protein
MTMTTRAIECVCGEHLEGRNDTALLEAFHSHCQEDHPDWSELMTTEYVIEAAWQEMAENAVDSAHFRYVHNTATVPEIEEYRTNFPEARVIEGDVRVFGSRNTPPPTRTVSIPWMQAAGH